MKLVIIESPGKASTLKKILGSGYEICASFGHVADLDEKKLSVDVKNDFKPTYKVLPSKKEVVDNLRKKASKAEAIYLCSDQDKEGERISRDIFDALKGHTKAPIYRASFTSITKDAVLNAINNPREIDDDLVEAQTARRVLDRIVGWKTSFLTKQAAGGSSSGRVQSVALRLLAERELEIQNFVPEEYWELVASLLSPHKEPFTARLDKKIKISNEDEARKIYDAVKVGTPVVKEVSSKIVEVRPGSPFTTQLLISAAKNHFGFSNEKTMKIAQDLYEGCDSGSGLISYHRSDACQLAPETFAAVMVCVKSLGKEYVPDKPWFYKNKPSAQAAHQAITPTNIGLKTAQSGDHKKLYELIWKRTIASQMACSRESQTKIVLDIAGHDFFSNGSSIVFDGFKKIYDYIHSEDVILPVLKEGDICSWKKTQ